MPKLLALPSKGCPDAAVPVGDLTLLEGYWEPNEKCLNPPVALLSWLIRNGASLRSAPFGSKLRERLVTGDPESVNEALRLLRTETRGRAWYIFEGPTCPDAYLVARDALVVIEGKRTEATVTTDTSWLTGRHQIWRHLDAAWEIRGNRAVYGFFIVENDAEPSGRSVSDAWFSATSACLEKEALRTSFPHRSADEARAISRCFLGATTWVNVCEHFQLDWSALPYEVPRL